MDQAIVDAANLSVELHKYVTLIMDEIYIKSDLVYDKHEGTLVGFVNIGGINNQILEFEAYVYQHWRTKFIFGQDNDGIYG